LKPKESKTIGTTGTSSLHTSNKTRIETMIMLFSRHLLKSVLYIHPIKQGLKLGKWQCNQNFPYRSLHTSNKTRIETRFHSSESKWKRSSLHTSNKTRIETHRKKLKILIRCCSLHTSNKTRIETEMRIKNPLKGGLVLYIHPIKQGLKHFVYYCVHVTFKTVLYIHPIKQGLKLNIILA